MIEFREPWTVVEDGSRLEGQLRREINPEHVLAGRHVRAIARRFDRDDVLFAVSGIGFAAVHLTWSRSPERSPSYPATELFATIDEFVERRMNPDHDECM